MAAVAASSRGEHRSHPLDRRGEGHRQLWGRPDECRSQRAVGAPQRAAQLAQGHRIHPAEGAGQQRLGPVVVEAVLGGGQHGQQHAGAGLLADGPAQRRLIHGNPGDRQCPSQRSGGGCRTHDHRQLRPRDTVDEVGPAQAVGDQGGLGMSGRGHRHGHRAFVGVVATVECPPAGPGQSGRHATDRPRDRRRAAVRASQGDRR